MQGRPDDLVKKCAVCYDGKHIIPMSEAILKKLSSVLVQWKSEGFDIFAFAFTPLSESQQKFLLHALEEQTIFHTRRHPETQVSTHAPTASESPHHFEGASKDVVCASPHFRV